MRFVCQHVSWLLYRGLCRTVAVGIAPCARTTACYAATAYMLALAAHTTPPMFVTAVGRSAEQCLRVPCSFKEVRIDGTMSLKRRAEVVQQFHHDPEVLTL
jgi:hypothetical protein